MAVDAVRSPPPSFSKESFFFLLPLLPQSFSEPSATRLRSRGNVWLLAEEEAEAVANLVALPELAVKGSGPEEKGVGGIFLALFFHPILLST